MNLNEAEAKIFLNGYEDGIKDTLEKVKKLIDERIEHYDLKICTKSVIALESLKNLLSQSGGSTNES